MLVANPGQAPYSIISTKPCSNKSTRNNATVSSTSRYIPQSSVTIESCTSTVVSKTMTAVTAIPTNTELSSLKTLSVRITREADLFRNTVQKTLPTKIPSHHISALNLYTVPPTTIHRYPERIETLSVDSLRSEMCHFKPIRTVPKTPAKRSKTATIKVPVAKKEDPSVNKNKRSKQSISLKEKIDYSQPRVSAFSLVTMSALDTGQQNKIDKSSLVSKKKDGQSEIICTVNTEDTDMSSVNFKAFEQWIPLNSIKHRTRHNTKTTLTLTLNVEKQNNETKPQKETRFTRKRQPQFENCEIVPEKNAKLSKDCRKPFRNERRQNSSSGRSQPNRRTPPVTRSRLKQSMIHTRKQYPHK